MLDTLIIGAGPGGLTAAVYLARFRRRVRLVSAGASRAELIPTTHNFPGFPAGVSGTLLLARLEEQAANHGVSVTRGRVQALERDGDGFTALIDGERVHARTVLLATGVLDLHPDYAGLQEATLAGLIRWCPICDGYEVLDQAIGLIAPARSGLEHALFLRTFSRSVTLVATTDSEGLSPEDVSKLERAGIELLTASVVSIQPDFDQRCVVLTLADGSQRRFDTLYPMHGCAVQGGLATALGADADEDGDLRVDARQCTSVPGLYAVGDVVSAINQISVAIGHAATAATAIHNLLPDNFRE